MTGCKSLLTSLDAAPHDSPAMLEDKETVAHAPVTVIIPAYNEAAGVANVIRQAREQVGEVAVVDDGSTDQTGNIAEQLGKENPRIKTVKHPQNLGYGAALSSGFKTAKLKWIMFSDADRQFNLEELAKFVPHISPGRMVIILSFLCNVDPFVTG